MMLHLIQVFGETTLNALMALGREGWSMARREIQKLLSKDEVRCVSRESHTQAVYLHGYETQCHSQCSSNWPSVVLHV